MKLGAMEATSTDPNHVSCNLMEEIVLGTQEDNNRESVTRKSTFLRNFFSLNRDSENGSQYTENNSVFRSATDSENKKSAS